LVKEDDAMHKWILKDDSVVCLCESCSKKDYKNLVMREQWKAKDKNSTVSCDRCGKKEAITF
jgi:uncharacterized Zn finger protein